MIAHDIVELKFSVLGNSIKTDHGYALYATIKKKILGVAPEILPENNFPDDVSLSRISGKEHLYFMYITRNSSFKIRCPRDYAKKIKELLNNQLLEFGRDKIFLHEGQINNLSPSNQLISTMVIIKYPFWVQRDCERRFLRSCRKQLAELEIRQHPTITEYEWNEKHQRTITVQKPLCRQQYIGYGVAISNLTEKDSILLQVNGIGGKRHMGCGWFE